MLVPAATWPQSGPLSNVTVWSTWSPFVQVTVPPLDTLDVVGANAILAIATCWPAPVPALHDTAAPPGAATLAAGGAGVELLPLHAVATARTNPAPRPVKTEIRTAYSHSLMTRHAARRAPKLTDTESALLRTLVG